MCFQPLIPDVGQAQNQSMALAQFQSRSVEEVSMGHRQILMSLKAPKIGRPRPNISGCREGRHVQSRPGTVDDEQNAAGEDNMKLGFRVSTNLLPDQ
ncbi:unnamed protein product [Arabis nemorensis]|uniref:Uncharacterized protein n=1 Tax=Arabis nemorensis TaxID=586526 RepID=A0A565CRI3_9BRAS|nr:unnamed protein product [Arabis nemorensis]